MVRVRGFGRFKKVPNQFMKREIIQDGPDLIR